LVANHWALDRPRPLPPRIQLVGPTENYTARAATRPPLPKHVTQWLAQAAGPVVYISLGTNVRPRATLISTLVAGMALAKDLYFLWDIREGMSDTIAELPDNVRAEESVDQLAVLASGHVAAFVSHCGLNSLHEAMHFAIPIVGLPFIADQLVSARIIEEVGVGRRLAPARLAAEEFAEAVGNVARSEAYREAARRVGRLAAAAGGAQLAADSLEVASDLGTRHLQMTQDGPAGRLWDVRLMFSLPLVGAAAALRHWLGSRSATPRPKAE